MTFSEYMTSMLSLYYHNKFYSLVGGRSSPLGNLLNTISKDCLIKFESCLLLLKQSWNATKGKFGLLQGVRGQSGFFNWALTERNIPVRLYLKIFLKSWDVEILIFWTNFQKSNIGWPQQPPIEKVQKLINYISWFH
jgi:hypothetical protein